MDVSVERTAQEMLTIMGKLDVSHRLSVAHISPSACFVFRNIEKMNLPLGVSQKEKVPVFREESHNLETLFLTTHPAMHLFLRQIACLNNDSGTPPPLFKSVGA